MLECYYELIYYVQRMVGDKEKAKETISETSILKLKTKKATK